MKKLLFLLLINTIDLNAVLTLSNQEQLSLKREGLEEAVKRSAENFLSANPFGLSVSDRANFSKFMVQKIMEVLGQENSTEHGIREAVLRSFNALRGERTLATHPTDATAFTMVALLEDLRIHAAQNTQSKVASKPSERTFERSYGVNDEEPD